MYTLSICIATLNRAHFITQMLDSILDQITPDCEIVVLDCASTDGTEIAVRAYAERFNSVRYIRQDSNNGIDRDYDRVVTLAAGTYCWLMSDDDTIKPGALKCVLEALTRDYSVVLVNAEVCTNDMTEIIKRRWANVDGRRVYVPTEADLLFRHAGHLLEYIGCVVIKRDMWLVREKERYYGSLMIHIGIIFQSRLPGPALLIGDPLVRYRGGNTNTYLNDLFELAMVRMPRLVDSLALAEETKRNFCIMEPWKRPMALLFYRALGVYSVAEYARWIEPRLSRKWQSLLPYLIAIAPGVAVNTLYVLCYAIAHRGRFSHFPRLIASRFCILKSHDTSPPRSLGHH